MIDTKSFEHLLADNRHLQRIEAIAKKRTQGTSVSWEDAAQIANMKLLQAVRAGKFRDGDWVKFFRWATSVAKNEIIDLVRKEKRYCPISLDQSMFGTELTILENLPGDSNPLDSLEIADLTLSAIDALNAIDQKYPHKHYRHLCIGQANGQTQAQLAAELGITQSAVSKRIKELALLMDEALELGLFSAKAVKQRHSSSKRTSARKRSNSQW
ncbi:sigma-70 family RNA polymerase sigma factor [Leptolyngbya sp. AN10]|uniref:sigma-70 family RNA polymerase sigma factor n=1 Tax=Leptolyngbya sp. AN10 TaxID=3423365 RepID=UPI003D31AAB7